MKQTLFRYTFLKLTNNILGTVLLLLGQKDESLILRNRINLDVYYVLLLKYRFSKRNDQLQYEGIKPPEEVV